MAAQKHSKAQTMTELDDLYRPYRPKHRTRAIIARKRFEPLAEIMLRQDQEQGSLEELAKDYIIRKRK